MIMNNQRRALLLNADYVPLNFISDIRAFKLVYKQRAEVLDFDGKLSIWDGEYFGTMDTRYEIPATIRLVSRVNKRFKAPRFRKKILFNRDNWQCQYCLCELQWSTVTIDHIVPKSQNGKTSWKNCVACCKSCNRKKANRTPEQANMHLQSKPSEPGPAHLWDMKNTQNWHNHWSTFVR